MAHYAYVNEGIVTSVIVGPDEDSETDWEAYFTAKGKGQAIRTSYNTRGNVHYDPVSGLPSSDQSKALRYNYAGIGFTYDSEHDAFIPPKPFDSWVLDEATCLWVAPVAYPEDGGEYTWDEATTSWVEVPSETV